MSASWATLSEGVPPPLSDMERRFPAGTEGMAPVVICRAPDRVYTPAQPDFRPVGSKWTEVMRWNHDTDLEGLPDVYMQIDSAFPRQGKSTFTLPAILAEAFGIRKQGFRVDTESCQLCFAYGPKKTDLSGLSLLGWNTLLQTILDWEDTLSQDPEEREAFFANMAIRIYDTVAAEHEVIPIEKRKVYVVDDNGDLQEVPHSPPQAVVVAVERPVDVPDLSPPPARAVEPPKKRGRVSRELRQLGPVQQTKTFLRPTANRLQ